MSMKILFLDIESSPNTAHVWGLWKQNVSMNQLMESSYVLSWAAKWDGDATVLFDSVHQSRPKTMLKRIHSLISEADVVVHYNGTKFDMPTLNKEFLLYQIPPPTPYKQVDLLKQVRNQFRFPSNKLDYVSQRLGLGAKVKHEGHELWVSCMAGDEEAWKRMQKYNKHDVILLEKLYKRLLPWIKHHPNRAVLQEELCCPTCGSDKLQRRGFNTTLTAKYQRYACMSCNSWSQATKTSQGTAAIKPHP